MKTRLSPAPVNPSPPRFRGEPNIVGFRLIVQSLDIVATVDEIMAAMATSELTTESQSLLEEIAADDAVLCFWM